MSTTAIRTIRVLKAFTDEQPALRFSDLMAATQLPKSTLVRFLNTLEAEGFVAHDRRSGYDRLGLELIVLGERALRQTQVHQVALPMLEQLAQRSGETVDLDVLSCREVITLASIPGRHVLATGRFVGKRWPAHATATGKLALAYLPPEQIKTFLAGPLESLTESTQVEPEKLRCELEQIRNQGYAVSREELELHLVAVAGAIKNAQGEVAAAISISGPRVRLQEDRLAEYIKMVQETCAEVSRQMGYVES